MSAALPKAARALIVLGGMSGCSIACCLARLGWSDMVPKHQMPRFGLADPGFRPSPQRAVAFFGP